MVENEEVMAQEGDMQIGESMESEAVETSEIVDELQNQQSLTTWKSNAWTFQASQLPPPRSILFLKLQQEMTS
jgi:hypothetical protein